MAQGKYILTKAEIHNPGGEGIYNLETTAHLAEVPRRMVLRYWRIGLIMPVEKSEKEEIFFNDESIYRIRRMEHLRGAYGINLAGIKMIMDLWTEVDRLKREVRFWQG